MQRSVLPESQHNLKAELLGQPEYQPAPLPISEPVKEGTVTTDMKELVDRCVNELQVVHDGVYVEHARAYVERISPLLIQQPQYQALVTPFLSPEETNVYRVHWLTSSGDSRVNSVYHVDLSTDRGPPFGQIVWDVNADANTAKIMALDQAGVNAFTAGTCGASFTAIDIDFHSLNDIDQDIFINALCRSFFTKIPAWHSMYPGPGFTRKDMGLLFGHLKKTSPEAAANLLLGPDYTPHSHLCPKEYEAAGLVRAVYEIGGRHGVNMANRAVTVYGHWDYAMWITTTFIENGNKVVCFPAERGYFVNPNGFKMEDITAIRAAPNPGDTQYWRPGPVDALTIPADVLVLTGGTGVTEDELDRMMQLNTKMVVETEPIITETQRAMMRTRDILFVPSQIADLGATTIATMVIEQKQNVLALTEEVVSDRVRTVVNTAIDSTEEAIAEYGLWEKDYAAGSAIWSFRKTVTAMYQTGNQ